MSFSKSNLIFGSVILILFLAAALYTWQDAAELLPQTGEFALPPESRILKFEHSETEAMDKWLYNIISPLQPQEVLEFFRSSLEPAGFNMEEVKEGKKFRFRKDEKVAELVLHKDPSGCVFTFIIRY